MNYIANSSHLILTAHLNKIKVDVLQLINLLILRSPFWLDSAYNLLPTNSSMPKYIVIYFKYHDSAI
jgi:hypothetical protein